MLSVEPVARHVNYAAVLREPLAQIIARLDLVFHDQYPHFSKSSKSIVLYRRTVMLRPYKM